MSGRTRLKKAVVAMSLSFLGLAGTFNTAAQTPERESAPSTPQAAPAKQVRSQQQLDIRVFSVFTSIHQQALMMTKRDPGYEMRTDPVILRKMDDIRTLLNEGANPDRFIGRGISLHVGSEMTAFQAAIALSMVMNAPDFLQFFIDKGADVHKLAPDQWSPMDVAMIYVMTAQGATPGAFKESLAILNVLTRGGAEINEARQMSVAVKRPLQNYADLAQNIIGAKILAQQGLITAAQLGAWKERHDAATRQPQLDRQIKNTPSLTAAWIKANGGKLNDFPDAPPGGPEPYVSLPGDTLRSVAERFQGVMNIADINQAVQAIAGASNLPADAVLAEKTNLLIPMPIGRQLGSMKMLAPRSLLEIAEALKESYYDKNASVAQIAQELAVMNKIDPAKIAQKDLIAKDQTIQAAYMAQMHLQFGPLTPPAHYKGGREVDLVVIEAGGEDSSHNKDTYRVSSNIAYGLNPAVDQAQIHSWAEMLLDFPDGENSDALRMLMNSEGSPINDRVVFSHSMAVFIPGEKVLKMRQFRDAEGTMLYNLINEYADQIERSRPIIFSASGNWNPEEARHVQSYAIAHSPRTVLIGAAGQYGPNNFMMAPYSSYGADVCAPLPKHLNEQMEGTSFATPLTAAVYRQLNEWYGDILTFEEIMAAGLMSADRDVNEDPKSANPNVSADGQVPKPARFDSNGGGIPNHERCGAGVLNIEKWQTALNRMVTIKQSLSRTAQEAHYDITVGAPVVIPGKNAGDKTQYVYRLSVPMDMTLGKLTFRLPQHKNKHSEIVVHTPAGFEKHLGYTHTDIMSTFAFAYEDVTAGQVIEIRTTEPLGPSAGMILRGHTPGNAIAVLRDHFRAQGVLPAPLQRMSGNTVIGPSTPVTPSALKDFIPVVPSGNRISAPPMPTPPTPVPMPQDEAPVPTPRDNRNGPQ